MRKLLLLIAFAMPVLAQTPADEWRTIATPHFRVHYPRAYEAWTQRAVTHIESIRDAVVRETGYDAPQRTDVLVVNPIASANGLTFPLLDTPRIVLYTEAPGPDSQIGEYGDWIDLLITHEMTHLEHLLRPSRNPAERLAEHVLLPFGPVLLSSPRWVAEGYATVVEGRLTGGGRPSSTLRAAILRKWAQSGRLPTYDDLDSGDSFLGMSMAYLAGSAYLEWLEARAGAGSLQKLWRRMSARNRRSFDSAFEGVFGDSPADLYGRFTAELTERAVTVDREAPLVEGKLWQETEHGSGDPAVSPDGRQIAVVERDEKGRAKLVIWSTGAPAEEEKKEEERIAKMLKRDPEDVAPVRTKPVERKAVHTLRMPLEGGITTPRWFADGKRILFSHRSYDREGDRHHDLYVWTPESENVQRVTRLADVSDADVFPDGMSAVAVRTRYGFSQLVRVDLATGSVAAMTEPSLDRVYSHPRVSRDGKQVAFAAHGSSLSAGALAGGRWQIVVRDLATGAERVVASPGNASSPEWSRTADDKLFASVMNGGYIDLHRFAGGNDEAITRMSGGALAPAPSPDGRMFFMSLERDGMRLRVLDKPAPAPVRTAFERSLVPALPPSPATAVAYASQPVPPSKAYGIGHQELGWILSGNSAPSAHTDEIGIKTSDVVGRLDAFALASLGNSKSPRGGTIAAAWRGLPVEMHAQAYRAREPLGEQHGLELRAVRESHFETMDFAIEGGALARHSSFDASCGADFSPRPDGRSTADDATGSSPRAQTEVCATRGIGSSGGALGFAEARGRLRQKDSSESLTLAAESHHARVVARGEAKFAGVQFGVEGQRDIARGVERVLVGGVGPTIFPRSALANRVLDPALETATLIGRRYTGLRADATLGPATLFYRRHDAGQRLDVKGIELVTRSGPNSILKTPGLAITLGGAQVEGRRRTWIAIRLEP